MGKIRHPDVVNDRVTEDEWEADSFHLIGDTASQNIVRTATLVVAANDASTASKVQADYVCDGVEDDVQIQLALDALPSGGGTVQLLEGTYETSGFIKPPSYSTLKGQGSNSTIINLASHGLVVSDVSHVRVEGIKITGSPSDNEVTPEGATNQQALLVYAKDADMEDLYFKDILITTDSLHTFRVCPDTGTTIDGITFDYCRAVDCVGSGFINYRPGQVVSNTGVIKHQRFINCIADTCGDGILNIWCVGFDVNEATFTEDVLFSGCTAYNS